MAESSRRGFLKAGAGAAILSTASCSIRRGRSPNIVLILTDQQHIDTISARGQPHVRTPALDWLAGRGTSFANSYCANPVCSPSRSALFTSRTASEADVSDNGRSIYRGIPNLGEWFSEKSSYRTVYAGKWHLPRAYQDTIAGFSVLPGGVEGQGNVGDSTVSRACEDFIRGHSGMRPFLLTASFLQPHDICEWLRLNLTDPDRLRYPEIESALPPLPANFAYDPIEPRALQELRQSNEPARGAWGEEHWRYYLWSYFRHIEMVDGEIGRILQALDDASLLRETVVVFTSDHGEGMAHHQTVRKSHSYDEAMRVPLLISWPGELPEDRHNTSSLASGLDIVPTLCDFAGIAPPPSSRGRSLLPLLAGRSDDAPGFLVSEIPPNAGRLVRTDRYKYVTYAGDTVEQLFDMKVDPGETRNLATVAEHASALADHKQLLRDWEARLNPAPGQPFSDAWWRRNS